VATPGGGSVKIIAGAYEGNGQRQLGPIHGISTDPTYLDVTLPAGTRFEHPIDSAYTAFVYPYEGSVSVQGQSLATASAGVLGAGDRILIEAPEPARFILLAGKPLREPIVQYGPFVMNTREEIEQALRDFQSGELTRY
jgi:quercetin 2,3-dioxygenase